MNRPDGRSTGSTPVPGTMANPQKRKGDNAEREIAKIIADLTGWPVKRALGAGRQDDVGDLYGIPDTTAQVKSYRDVSRAVREGLDCLNRQLANSGDTYGVCFIRRPGGRWVAVMEVEQWATYARESHSCDSSPKMGGPGAAPTAPVRGPNLSERSEHD